MELSREWLLPFPINLPGPNNLDEIHLAGHQIRVANYIMNLLSLIWCRIRHPDSQDLATTMPDDQILTWIYEEIHF